MKKLIALVLAALMTLSGACFAATWPEGCSPSKPYAKLNEVDLTQTMGYIMLYPREKLPVNQFCDVLEIYLPRDDIERGTGMLHLYENIPGEKNPVEVCSMDFSSEDSVEIRPLNEQEMNSLMWGGGYCVDIHLPKSLEFGDRTHSYFVLMDEGGFTAANGSVKAIGITSDEAWHPIIGGDYGISGLYYLDAPYVPKALGTAEPEMRPDAGVSNYEGDTAVLVEDSGDTATLVEDGDGYAPEVVGVDGESVESFESGSAGFLGADDEPEETATPEPEPTATPEPVAEDGNYVVRPDAGDIVHFDIIMGADAVSAIPYSENGSVEFSDVEFRETTHVTGTVLKDEVQWGVVFLNDEGSVIQTFEMGRVR